MGIWVFRFQRLGQDAFYSARVNEVHVQSLAAGGVEECSVGRGLQRTPSRSATATAVPQPQNGSP